MQTEEYQTSDSDDNVDDDVADNDDKDVDKDVDEDDNTDAMHAMILMLCTRC
jgi:hypothetical protein